MRYFIALTAVLLLFSFSKARGQDQNGIPDTLTLNAKDYRDSASIRKLIDLCFKNRTQNLPEALKLAIYTYNRAKRTNSLHLQAGAINQIAIVYRDMTSNAKALEYFYQALRLFEKLDYPHGTATCLANIGSAINDTGKPDEAIKYLNDALVVTKKNKLTEPLALIYSNLVSCYFQKQDLKNALLYGLKTDSITSKAPPTNMSITNLNNVGALYFLLGDKEKSLYYNRKTISLATPKKLNRTLGMTFGNTAELYETTPYQDSAQIYYVKALREFTQVKDYASLQYTHGMFSNFYKKRKDFATALKYADSANMASAQNTRIQNQKNIAELQTQYETEKKEQKIELLNKENTIQKYAISRRNITISLIGASFLAAIAFGGLFYNRNKLKQETRLQQEIMKQQDLATKAVLEAEEKERTRIAGDLHDGVGQMFSTIKMNLVGLTENIKFNDEQSDTSFQKTLALVDESCKEVRSISHQLAPNVLLKYGLVSAVRDFISQVDSRRLDVHLETEGLHERLESNVETVIYRVIQETVNNVIKHAQATQLDIQLIKEPTILTVMIEDNGKGFDVKKAFSQDGIGLQNISSRVEFLKGTVDIDSSPGRGTVITINIPLAA